MNAAKSRYLPKVDNRSKFRSFIIAYHKKYGYLLLRSYKPQKGLHFQLPGGHIDKNELRNDSLAHASLVAAHRELFEETGLNIDRHRLKRINLGIKNRLYFELLLTDADSLQIKESMVDEDEEVKVNLLVKNKLSPSLNETQDTFFIQLSHEHNAWQFELDIYKASDLVKFHSAGKNAKALKLYAQRARHEKKKAKKLLKKQLKAKKKKEKKSALENAVAVLDDMMAKNVVELESNDGQVLNSNQRYISVVSDHVDEQSENGSPMSSALIVRETSSVQVIEDFSNDENTARNVM